MDRTHARTHSHTDGTVHLSTKVALERVGIVSKTLFLSLKNNIKYTATTHPFTKPFTSSTHSNTVTRGRVALIIL